MKKIETKKLTKRVNEKNKPAEKLVIPAIVAKKNIIGLSKVSAIKNIKRNASGVMPKVTASEYLSTAELEALWITGYAPTQQDFANLFESIMNFEDYGRKYKEYAFMPNFDGSSINPIVFDNTIGAIVWNRYDTGVYTGTLAGAFNEDTLFGLPARWTSRDDNNQVVTYWLEYGGDSVIYLNCADSVGHAYDPTDSYGTCCFRIYTT